jgi:hypothetical protein
MVRVCVCVASVCRTPFRVILHMSDCTYDIAVLCSLVFYALHFRITHCTLHCTHLHTHTHTGWKSTFLGTVGQHSAERGTAFELGEIQSIEDAVKFIKDNNM